MVIPPLAAENFPHRALLNLHDLSLFFPPHYTAPASEINCYWKLFYLPFPHPLFFARCATSFPDEIKTAVQIISYDSPRGGVSVITEKGETSTSFLLIQNARPSDSGQYQVIFHIPMVFAVLVCCIFTWNHWTHAFFPLSPFCLVQSVECKESERNGACFKW